MAGRSARGTPHASRGAGGAFATAAATGGNEAARPILIVSDLDGTMVGDDDATAEFTASWNERGGAAAGGGGAGDGVDEGAHIGRTVTSGGAGGSGSTPATRIKSPPPGSVLVYSTGRSLESFTALIEHKAKVMATPDALVCAVGTKIYRRAPFPPGGARDPCDPPDATQVWTEDREWTAHLDQDWNFHAVLEAAAAAVAAAGSDNAHFRPEEEFTAHKITLGVKDAFVAQVTEAVRARCGASALRVKIIASGVGGWQYLDVVSAQAGKLESLERVRSDYGVPVDRTVACGDSGNDTLMLSGRNRAIVVGNAQPALMQWARREMAKEGGGRLYISQEREARGILEGLDKFGFLI